MSVYSLVGVSGGVSDPSRTSAVVQALLLRIQRRLRAEISLIEISKVAPHLGGVLSRDALDYSAEATVRCVETADILVVATPVYRGSYTGAFKHLFDLVDYRALTGKTVVLATTGGSPYHGLVLEHQLRPLFGFFGAITVPTTVYGVPEDFREADIVSAALQDRIARTAADAVSLMRSQPSNEALSAAVG